MMIYQKPMSSELLSVGCGFCYYKGLLLIMATRDKDFDNTGDYMI